MSTGLIDRIDTEKDVMRYGAVTENHHHLYCSDSDGVEDYYDEELTKLLIEYFNREQIPNFKFEDLRLQINGKFNK